VIALTRSYRFPAAHVLASAALSDEDNRRIYGKCANPAGHGHDYGIEVSVAGALDPRTGAIFPIERLDAIVRERVIDRLSHRLLNGDPWFAATVPTAEQIALTLERELRDAVAAESSAARVVRVRVVETRRNSFACGEAEG
jgi:6-pyruvoyltetrahydropterin/6-carboxytetrahydropterin synthase